jgi:hypothetical protein
MMIGKVRRERSALLAQWLERAAVNRKVTGSIPVGSDFVERLRGLNQCGRSAALAVRASLV